MGQKSSNGQPASPCIGAFYEPHGEDEAKPRDCAAAFRAAFEAYGLTRTAHYICVGCGADHVWKGISRFNAKNEPLCHTCSPTPVAVAPTGMTPEQEIAAILAQDPDSDSLYRMEE